MGEKSYFMLTHSTVNSNGGYYTSDVFTIQTINKFTTKANFEDKFLVWIAMVKGLSRSFIRILGPLLMSNDI